MKNNNKRGFTLIELLIVIGIIAILAAAVIVAINPGQQFAQARNATRWNHINSLNNSIFSFSVDNQGQFPDCLVGEDGTDRAVVDDADYEKLATDPTWYYLDVCFGDEQGRVSSDGYDSDHDEIGSYMSDMPADPQDGHYYIGRVDNNDLIITSTATEFNLEDAQ